MEDAVTGLRPAAKARARRELLMWALQPLADRGVRLLARLGVNPLLIVATHALVGLVAASLLALGLLLPSALLLQLKTLLDNMDGGVARATDQVTLLGRYLDTGLDFIVNAALFWALARHGPPLLALAGFLALTLLLSLDFNAERLYQEARAEHAPPEPLPPIGAPRLVYLAFKSLYDALLAPQDRLIARLERWRFRALSGQTWQQAPQELRRAWADLFSSASLVNLGLSTQMLLLGVCLALGHPFWYVYAVFGQACYVLGVQGLRGWRFRRYLDALRGAA